MSEKYITLHAGSLASKWGFADGDILDDFDSRDVVGHDILVELVRTHLLPLMPPELDVYEIVTIHNPIRATDGWVEFCRASDVAVKITWSMAVAAKDRVARRAKDGA